MEIDYEKLAKTGIKISDRDYDKKDPQKMLCPACKNGRKKHKKNKPLAVYWKDCYAKCFNCGESFFFGKTQKLNDGQQPNTQPMKKNCKEYKKPGKLENGEPLDENMRKWFEGRGIPVEIAEAEGIVKASRKMPQTEKVLNSGYDVLCMTDNVDEFAIKFMGEYDKKPFKNATQETTSVENNVKEEDKPILDKIISISGDSL